MEKLSSKKRERDDSDELETSDSPELKRFCEDLLDYLDDSVVCASHDLDSFMKSFEEEIASSSSPLPSVADPVSESCDFQPELGYLLEASDDELGLPPSNGSPTMEGRHQEHELERVTSNSSEFNQLWGFDDEIPSYDTLSYGVTLTDGNANGTVEYVALDGLFDYSDLGCGSFDNLRLPETLPAQ